MIVAVGGGELEGDQTRGIDGFIVQSSGKRSPHVLFVPTASKDAPGYASKVEAYFGDGWGCPVQILSLTKNPSPKTVAALTAWADVVYVGGGDTHYLLKTWNRYGMKPLFEAALARGAVLSGISAGAICWFDGGIAAYNGYKPLPGLGLAPGLVLPHFEPGNGAALDSWFAADPSRSVFGIGDRAALTWDGSAYGVVREVPGTGVWRVTGQAAEAL